MMTTGRKTNKRMRKATEIERRNERDREGTEKIDERRKNLVECCNKLILKLSVELPSGGTLAADIVNITFALDLHVPRRKAREEPLSWKGWNEMNGCRIKTSRDSWQVQSIDKRVKWGMWWGEMEKISHSGRPELTVTNMIVVPEQRKIRSTSKRSAVRKGQFNPSLHDSSAQH